MFDNEKTSPLFSWKLMYTSLLILELIANDVVFNEFCYYQFYYLPKIAYTHKLVRQQKTGNRTFLRLPVFSFSISLPNALHKLAVMLVQIVDKQGEHGVNGIALEFTLDNQAHVQYQGSLLIQIELERLIGG